VLLLADGPVPHYEKFKDETVSGVFFVFQRACPKQLPYPHTKVSGILLVDVVDDDCLAHVDSVHQVKHFNDGPSCLRETVDIFFSNSDFKKSVVCVACDDLLKQVLKERAISMITPSIEEFHEMNWLEAITPGELLLWDKVSFEISVITTCRMKTLKPLMEAILGAKYLGDRVDLHVSVDTNATSECLNLLEAFNWKHGGFHIRRRVRSAGGAEVAVPEGIGATGTVGHYGVLLEDDIFVSSEFYSWLKFAGLQIEGGARKEHKIFSISLYTPRVVETGTESRQMINYDNSKIREGSAFLYEVPCSWGSAFSALYWPRALSYFENRLSGQEKFEPIPNSRVNGWTGSWKKWLIELEYYKHWTTLYPRFKNERSFSTNLLQKGQHITDPTASEVEMYIVPTFHDNDWYSQLQSKRLFPINASFDLHFDLVQR